MPLPVIIVDCETKAAVWRARLGDVCEVMALTEMPAGASWQPPRDKLKRGRPGFGFSPAAVAAPFWRELAAVRDREIYLALENHPAGEYWSWLLAGTLAEISPEKVVGRLRLLGYGPAELEGSFRLVDVIHEEPALLHHIRLMLDSCLGKHLERLLGTRQGPGDLPLDYRSLAIIALLREREARLKAPPPAPKWQVRVILATEQGSFPARLGYAYGVSDNGYFARAGETRGAIELFRNESVVVKSIRRHNTRLAPPRPYSWPELMTEAVLLHGFTPRQVSSALEELYRGVRVDGTLEGLISACWGLEPISPAPLLAKIRRFLGEAHGQAETNESDPDLQAGSLLPLRPELDPEKLPVETASETRIIYGMIRARALAGQMAPAMVENAEIEFGCGESCLFSATLRRPLTPGFLTMDQEIKDKELSIASPLDVLKVGRPMAIERIIPESVGAGGVEPYTLASLVADLKEYGLETDPALISRISRMFELGYLTLLAEGKLGVGENTTRTAAILERALPTLPGPQLPAFMEQLCRELASGRKPLDFGLRQFEQTMIMQGNILVKVEAVSRSRRRPARGGSIIKAESDLETRPEKEPGKESNGAGSPESAALGISAADEPAPAVAVEPETMPAREAPTPLQPEPAAAPAQPLPPEAGMERVTGRCCPVCALPLLVKEDPHGRYLVCSGFPRCRHAESCRREEESVDRQAAAAPGKSKVRRVVRRVGTATAGKRKVVVRRKK